MSSRERAMFLLIIAANSAGSETRPVNWNPDRIGKVDLSHEYLARIASLIGGKVRRTENPNR
jgi:hypothetical protein